MAHHFNPKSEYLLTERYRMKKDTDIIPKGQTTHFLIRMNDQDYHLDVRETPIYSTKKEKLFDGHRITISVDKTVNEHLPVDGTLFAPGELREVIAIWENMKRSEPF